MAIVLAALVWLALAAISCESTPVPTPTPTLFSSPISFDLVYLPGVFRTTPKPWTSAKKGFRRHLAPCSDRYGRVWEYLGPGGGEACAGIDTVLYLGHPVQIAAQLTKSEPGNRVIMLYNELDTPLFAGSLTLDEMVEPVVSLLDRWPHTQVVGLCNAHGPELTTRFRNRYQELAGEPLPLRAACVHCYSSAADCVDRVKRAASVTGLPVWVTEFNLPPGRNLTIDQVIQHNGCFILWMENSDLVERYSPWAGFFEYGTWVPADRVTGWQPLEYPYRRNGRIEWDYTEIGRAYAFYMPTWADCLAGGYLRLDQVPPEHRPTPTATSTPTATPRPWPLTRVP